MFADILAAMVLGLFLGTLTGLVPGIHPNTLFFLLVSGLAGLYGLFPETVILVFIISVAVSNTFTDFLPSILFGAPDPSTALSVLPGHRMLLEGRGHEAVLLTVVGGLGVALLTVLTLPVLVFLIVPAFQLSRPLIHILLLLIAAWMVLSETGTRKIHGALVFLLSGAMGFITLNAYPSGTMIFPSLTGLFAISSLLTSYFMKTVLPPQERPSSVSGDLKTGILMGWIGGWFAGLLPGIGASQSGAAVSQALRTRTSEFITALGGINTSNIIFTFVLFYLVGSTRSGAAWAISQFVTLLSPAGFSLLLFAALTVCFLSSVITILLSRSITSRMLSFDYQKINLAVVSFLFLVVAALSGLPGILACVTGTFTGLYCIRSGARRSHMMGYLILPTILYFSGASPVFLTYLAN